ncbi:MAG: pyruvate kinase alpha/beta domain-containing protein [candidate division WOR-3 bacterium]
MVKCQIHYWSKPGKENTLTTLREVLRTAQDEKIKYVIIASSTGATIKEFLKLKPEGINTICVTHHTGFIRPGFNEMNKATENYLKKQGVAVLRTTHFFGGMGRAVRLKFGGLYPDEIAANVLRIFGEGIKVAVEISIMALDAGLIPAGKKIIAVGGTDQGADAAIVITPAHGKNFFNTRVHKIICKPL